MILHLTSKPDNGLFREEMKTQRPAFKRKCFRSRLRFILEFLPVHLFIPELLMCNFKTGQIQALCLVIPKGGNSLQSGNSLQFVLTDEGSRV